MSRRLIALTAFFAAAFAAMVAMMVIGRPRRPHPAAPPQIAPATPAGAATPGASRTGAEVDGELANGAGIPPGYRATNARNFIRMRLRELTMAEENYYQESNSYTTDLSKLMLPRRTGDVVVLRVTFAGPAGWSAEGTHPALPGKNCVTYAGPLNLLPIPPATTADHVQPLGERDMVCDKP